MTDMAPLEMPSSKGRRLLAAYLNMNILLIPWGWVVVGAGLPEKIFFLGLAAWATYELTLAWFWSPGEKILGIKRTEESKKIFGGTVSADLLRRETLWSKLLALVLVVNACRVLSAIVGKVDAYPILGFVLSGPAAYGFQLLSAVLTGLAGLLIFRTDRRGLILALVVAAELLSWPFLTNQENLKEYLLSQLKDRPSAAMMEVNPARMQELILVTRITFVALGTAVLAMALPHWRRFVGTTG